MEGGKPKLFQLIDLDRTLFDTERFLSYVIAMVSEIDHDVGTTAMERFQQTVRTEGTFFPLQYMREHLGNEKLLEIIDKVIDEHPGDKFLLPGAAERVQAAESLTSARPAWGILTFGNTIDQPLKARIAGFGGVPLCLTDTSDKATVLSAWKCDDGTFQLPPELGGERVDSLSLEDDKLRAFQDMPEGVRCIWVTDREDAVEKIRVLDVAIAKDLRQSIDILS